MQSEPAHPQFPEDSSAGDWLDSEERLMQALLERLFTLPAEKRVEIAVAFHAHLGAEQVEENAPWQNTYRKELAHGEIDRERVEAAVRAKRAARG